MATYQQREQPKEELFIDGYLTRRIKSGVMPKYGYPKNHLPDVTKGVTNTECSLLIAKKHK